MTERVLVTGASGFAGRALVHALTSSGLRVRALDSVPPPRDLPAGVEVVTADVRDAAAVARAVRGVNAVVHGVAVQPVSRSRRALLHDVNVNGTRHVLSAARACGVRRVVHLSSSAPYGVPREVPLTEDTPFAPVCEYGRSKAEAERVCAEHRANGLDVIVLRPRVLIGPGRLGLYQMVFNWVADGRRVYVLGSGDRPFQALSVRDLVDACLLALAPSAPRSRSYNLGAGAFGTLRQDLEALVRHAGTHARVASLPAAPARAALWALDVLDLSPLTAWHYLTCDTEFHFDCARARRELGWAPRVSNAEMLREAYDWYVAHRATVDPDTGTTHTKSLPQRAFRLLKALS